MYIMPPSYAGDAQHIIYMPHLITLDTLTQMHQKKAPIQVQPKQSKRFSLSYWSTLPSNGEAYGPPDTRRGLERPGYK